MFCAKQRQNLKDLLFGFFRGYPKTSHFSLKGAQNAWAIIKIAPKNGLVGLKTKGE